MPHFNPNDPNILGMEWIPNASGAVLLDSPAKAVAQTMRAQATDTIGIVAWRTAVQATYPTLITEVFNEGSEVPSNVTYAAYLPNEDVAGTVLSFVNQASATTNLYQSVDESIPAGSIDDSNWIGNDNLPASYGCRFGTAGVLTGKRILGVSFAWATSASVSGATYQVNIVYNGVTKFLGTYSSATTGFLQQIRSIETPIVDPTLTTTSALWTPAAVQNFDAGSYYLLINVLSGSIRFYAINMIVHYSDENRLAWGVTTGGSGTTEFSLLNPAAGTSFSRTNGNDYTYLLRLMPAQATNASLNVPTISAGPPIPTLISYPSITVEPVPSNANLSYDFYVGGVIGNGNGFVEAAADMGDAGDLGFAVTTRTTAPAWTADGQPYYQISEAECYTSNDVEQEFDPSTNDSYELVRALVSPLTTDDDLDDLVVNIRNRSGDTLMGTGTFTKAEWDVLPNYGNVGSRRYKEIFVELSSVSALSAAATYYIEFQSAANGGEAPDGGTNAWGIAYLAGMQGEPGYGGTTLVITVNGSDINTADAVAVAIDQPTAPANPVVSIETQTVPEIGGICTHAGHQYALIEWDATSLSGDFDHYEVSRSYDAGTTWEVIADNITPESHTELSDYEGRRGVETLYRVRVIRADGAPSPWAETSEITPEADGCVVAFVSNRQPDLNCAYMDETPRNYDFLNADEIQTVPIYDRDYQVAFKPLENRGVRWPIAVQVWNAPNMAAQEPASPGLAAFDSLRAIADADLPYVCVLDSDGAVLYSSLQVPSGTTRRDIYNYTAEVIATQITATPDTEPEL